SLAVLETRLEPIACRASVVITERVPTVHRGGRHRAGEPGEKYKIFRMIYIVAQKDRPDADVRRREPKWHDIVDERIVGCLSHLVAEHEDIAAVRQNALVVEPCRHINLCRVTKGAVISQYPALFYDVVVEEYGESIGADFQPEKKHG